VKINYDQRGDKRFKYEAAIWHENILPGRFYKAKICNISQSGIYFESDQALYQGEKIYIGNKNPQSAKNISNDCAKVEIKWRRDLKDSSFRHGYGAEFLDSDNSLIKSIDQTKIADLNTRGTSGRYRKDPREHIREPYRKEIVFTTKNRQYEGSITNISRGGAFITTKNKFALGETIQLDIREDPTCKAVKLKGWVVRLSPSGVGVKFDRRMRRDRRKKVDRRDRRGSVKKEAGPKR
jgi:Tfp pilus assembly protein PilZ